MQGRKLITQGLDRRKGFGSNNNRRKSYGEPHARLRAEHDRQTRFPQLFGHEIRRVVERSDSERQHHS